MIEGRPSPKIQLAGAVALAVSILLSACSGGSSSTPRPADPSTSAAPATTTAMANPASTVQTASGSGSRPVPTGGDMCRLVTKAEAAALVGRDVQDGESTSSEQAHGTTSSCMYHAAPVQPPTLVHVFILGNKFSHDQFLELFSKAPDATDQPGIGEDAKFVPGVLSVYDHNTVLSVQIVVDGKPAPANTVISVAKKALGRL